MTGCEGKEAESSHIPKRGKPTREDGSREKGKKLALLEAKCTGDPCVISRWCQGPQETSRICKKVEDFHLHINEGVLT